MRPSKLKDAVSFPETAGVNPARRENGKNILRCAEDFPPAYFNFQLAN